MSEREYFSVRYLIPGSTFLLPILAYNIFPLYDFLRESQVSVSLFGAVLAILGSPTIGFLVSQFFWKWREEALIPWKMGGAKVLADNIEAIGLKFKFSLKTKDNKDDKENIRKALILYDYVLHSKLHSDTKKTGLSGYAFRRYDNYVLIKCTMLCLGLGTLLGITGRLAGWAMYPIFYLGNHELVWLIIVSIVIVILLFMMRDGAQHVCQEHKDLHEAIIRELIAESKNDKYKLRNAFPDYLEIKNETSTSRK